jgi:MFS family permease
VVIAAGVVGMIMTGGGQAYIFSLFISDVTTDLNVSRSVVSSLYTLGSFLGSMTMPWMGQKIDRLGSRRMVTIIAFAFGIASIYMGYVENVLMLGIGFVVLRVLGPGGLALVSENVINQWWHERRGMAIGLSNMLFALFGVALVPNLVGWAITVAGWRATFQGMGVILLAVMAPLGYLLFRDRPELYGLIPDGRSRLASRPFAAEPDPAEINWTLIQALRAPVFWIISLGVGALALFVTGLLFHQVAIFADNGLSTTAATAAFLPISVAMAVLSLTGGLVMDHVPARLVLGSALIVLAGALLLARGVSTVFEMVLFGLLLGSATGLMRTLSGSIWAIYFGRLHLGSISGTARAIVIAGAALGPMPFGIIRDVTGRYDAALLFSAAVVIVLGLLVLLIRMPQR